MAVTYECPSRVRSSAFDRSGARLVAHVGLPGLAPVACIAAEMGRVSSAIRFLSTHWPKASLWMISLRLSHRLTLEYEIPNITLIEAQVSFDQGFSYRMAIRLLLALAKKNLAYPPLA